MHLPRGSMHARPLRLLVGGALGPDARGLHPLRRARLREHVRSRLMPADGEGRRHGQGTPRATLRGAG